MKLFLVHCGFYDSAVCEGQYEFHVNFFVVADSVENAKTEAKKIPEFLAKKMHIDGLQEVEAVGGYEIGLVLNPALENRTVLLGVKFRELAPTIHK